MITVAQADSTRRTGLANALSQNTRPCACLPAPKTLQNAGQFGKSLISLPLLLSVST